ncbi:MAG: hypothetical protein HKM06_02135 [Spirochaetales bacterium]|nr:hypothetical protein [Spirochaetales bacterium]
MEVSDPAAGVEVGVEAAADAGAAADGGFAVGAAEEVSAWQDTKMLRASPSNSPQTRMSTSFPVDLGVG